MPYKFVLNEWERHYKQKLDAKTINTIDQKQNSINEIAEKINLVLKSIVSGKGSNERFFELEMKLKYLNARLIDIANTNPVNLKSQLVSDQSQKNAIAFDWNTVNKLL